MALRVAAGLTQVVFPAYYGQITLGGDKVWLPVLAMAVRNCVMVVLLVVAAQAAYRGLQTAAAATEQPRGPATTAGHPARVKGDT